MPGAIPAVFMRGAGGGPYYCGGQRRRDGIVGSGRQSSGASGLPADGRTDARQGFRVLSFTIRRKTATEFVRRTGVQGIKTNIDIVVQQGQRHRGWDPGKVWNLTLTNQQIDDLVKSRRRHARGAGAGFGLMLECHTRFDTESALQIAKALEPFRPMWIEEPVPPDNVDAMAYVRSHTRIPIACGENVYGRFGYRQYLEKQAASIIQPDMAKCGGLWETRKIAAMAEVYHIPIAPHGVATRLGEQAYAHVCSTVPNFMILEWMHFRDDSLQRVDHGSRLPGRLPARPGYARHRH